MVGSPGFELGRIDRDWERGDRCLDPHMSVTNVCCKHMNLK